MKQRSHTPLLLISFFLLLLPAGFVVSAPQLSANLEVASEGYFVLSWEEPESSAGLVLQESLTEDFSGDIDEWSVELTDQFTQSGLTNGVYHYRLLDQAGSSNVVSVEVRHHTLARASLFFSIGAVLFVILVTVLINGRRRLQGTQHSQ